MSLLKFGFVKRTEVSQKQPETAQNGVYTEGAEKRARSPSPTPSTVGENADSDQSGSLTTTDHERIVPAPPAQKRKRESTFRTHSWIVSRDEGYYCDICQKYRENDSGTWLTIPLAKGNSKKLYTKAEKHAGSIQHRIAAEKAAGCYGSTSVAEKVNIHATQQTEEGMSIMKAMFRAAYFMFCMELPHTTNWRPLMSTIAALDMSNRIATFLQKAGGNAHHLSPKSVTEILESFGEAMFESAREELSTVKDFAILADECTDINGREMLSICVQYIKSQQVVKRFVAVVPVVSTKADSICNTLIDQMRKYCLDPTQLTAASFDGASNFSGAKGGVQALLKQHSPAMVYVHCRSHALQLYLVKACQSIPNIKRVVSTLNKLFTVFRGSAKRLNVLYDIEIAIDKQSHKLVQPGDTRWLSHEASVEVVCKHYPAICLALEHIYQDAGNMSSDAGGLLLTLRKDSTIFVLALLSVVLKPLARLSKALQSGSNDISNAMAYARAVIGDLTDTVAELSTGSGSVGALAAEMKKRAGEQNVHIEIDATADAVKSSKKYINVIVAEMERRFSDDIGKVASIQEILKDKPEAADFSDISRIFRLSEEELKCEWRILRRMDGDLSSSDGLLALACSREKAVMFPTFIRLAQNVLLLPIGTAGVERSFSTLNRILNSERCRLLPDHVDMLMKISIEGPEVPDVRSQTPEMENKLSQLTDSAYAVWRRRPRRE